VCRHWRQLALSLPCSASISLEKGISDQSLAEVAAQAVAQALAQVQASMPAHVAVQAANAAASGVAQAKVQAEIEALPLQELQRVLPHLTARTVHGLQLTVGDGSIPPKLPALLAHAPVPAAAQVRFKVRASKVTCHLLAGWVACTALSRMRAEGWPASLQKPGMKQRRHHAGQRRHCTAQRRHCAAQHSTAQHSTAQHGTLAYLGVA